MGWFEDLLGIGSSANTTTTTQTPSVPPDVEAARRDLLGRAQAFAAEPYSPYVMRRPGMGGGPVNMGPGSGGAPPAGPVNMGPESGGGMNRYLPPEMKPGGGDTFKADLGVPDRPFGISVGVPGTPTYREQPMALPGKVGGGDYRPPGSGDIIYSDMGPGSGGAPMAPPSAAAGIAGFPDEEYVPIPRVAGFTPDQLAAFEAARNLASSSGALGELTPGLTSEAILRSRDLATTLPETDIQAYMSPYTQAVLDPAIRDIEERAARKRLELGQQSARTGSFGGSRQAIAESELERGTQRNIADVSALERSKAYNQALDQFRKDQTSIPELYKGALGALTTGLAQTGSRLATEYNPLLQIGSAQQALGQANLDVLRKEFEEQRDYPLRGMEALRGALGIGSTALGVGSTGTTQAPGPNVLGQVFGTVAAAPGVIKAGTSVWDWASGLFR